MSSGREKFLGSIQFNRMEVYFYEPTQQGLNPLAVPFVPGQLYPVEVLVPDSYVSSLNPKACEFVPCAPDNYTVIDEMTTQIKTGSNTNVGDTSIDNKTSTLLGKNDELDADDDDECSPYIGMCCWH